MKKVLIKKAIVITLIVIFSSIFFVKLDVSFATISVSSYCQLSIQSMQLEIGHLNDLISIINQYQDDPETQAQQISIKKTEYNQTLTSLYTSFETTGNEYVMYLGKHDRDVASYLDSNPDIKQQIDNLTSQIKTLLAQYESLKGYEGEQPPQEPPLP